MVNLINLSLSCEKKVHFVFCSSTASIAKLGGKSKPIWERPPGHPMNSADVGYGRSKWVAETICHRAQRNTVAQISVVRIGQLTGDTVHGIWNESEAWPLMLSTAHQLGCLPAIDEILTWLPLNIAATAIIQITTNRMLNNAPAAPQFKFYHVVNNSKQTHWNDMLRWIQEFHEDPLRVVSLEEWLDELDALEGDHPAKVLSDLWRNADKASKQIEGQEPKRTEYVTQQTAVIAPIMLGIMPVDKELIKSIWEWITTEMSVSV
jgi:thioester reductase-like protein